MKIFVTGASGWIASAAIPELLKAGHHVVGLARSDAAAARVLALGAEVRRGDLADTGALIEAAAASDGVIHLGYHHDFSQMAQAAALDRAAIDAFGSALQGTGKPLLFASGLLGVSSEAEQPQQGGHPRVGNALAATALAERGVRPVAVRFAPTVHGKGDYGFTSVLAQVARDRGVSAYVGDGSNVWPAVHRLDAGRVVALALDIAPAGAAVHAVAENGVPTKAIAEAIGHALGLPVESVPAEKAAEHFGWIGMFFAGDFPTSNDQTRALLGWQPAGPTLLEDIEAGYYTAA